MSTELETIDLNNVPIFSVGKWEGNGSAKGGDRFSANELDDIVNSFNKVGDKVKPRLILGHDKEKSEKFSGYPALGWITGLKRDGENLLADLKEVPKKIKSLIDKKAYGRFSPGIWKKMSINGEDHKRVLDHVALLGGTIPANTSLDGFIDLYEFDENSEDLIQYNKQVKEPEMEDSKVLETKVADLMAQLEGVQAELKTISDEKDAAISENTELKKEFEQIQLEKKKGEIESMVKEAVKDNKITPAQEELFVALAMNEDGITKYEHGDKVVEGDKIALIEKIIDSNSQVKLDEKSVKGDVEPQTFSKKKEEDDGSSIDAKAKDYIKDNPNVDYRDAIVIVAGEEE